jgi:hypothetical protein
MRVKNKTIFYRNKLISLSILLLLPVFASANSVSLNPVTTTVYQPINNLSPSIQKAYFYYGRHWHRPLWVGHSYHDYYYADPGYAYADDPYYHSGEGEEGVLHKSSDEPQYYGYGYNYWHWIAGHWVYRSYFGWKWVPSHWERS